MIRRRSLLAAGLTFFQTGQNMAEANSDPWLWFRMKTGIVDVVHPPKPGPGLVLAQWPAAPALLGVDAAWTITDDFFYIPNARGASHRYAARQGQQTREVELFLSADGFPGAVERVLEIATTTMLPNPPYDKAPETARFGEITLASDDPAHRTLIWTFRNLCVRVDTSGGGEDTRALARRLLDGLQRRVVEPAVFNQARPRLTLPDSEIVLRPGESARIVPTPAGGPVGLTRLGVVLAEPATLRCDAGVVICAVR